MPYLLLVASCHACIVTAERAECLNIYVLTVLFDEARPVQLSEFKGSFSAVGFLACELVAKSIF